MIKNNLCPQHYVNMVVDYVNSRSSGYTADMIVEYCISKTAHLDKGDERRIDRLVFDTLEELKDSGYISNRGDWYKTRKNVSFSDCFIKVEDKVRPMQITKEKVDAVNKIDLYGGFLTTEEENEI